MTETSETSPRRFGLTVGGVFLLLGGVAAWRGHTVSPRVLAGVGTLLVVPALLVPRMLIPVERAWMRLALLLAAVNTRIILGGLYYLVLTPAGFVRRAFHDPLSRRLRTGAPSYWVRRGEQQPDAKRYRQQF